MLDTKVLLNLHARISAFKVTYCGLVHERVAWEAGGVKRRQQDVDTEPSVVRVGLCTAKIRSCQLSCAHTLARHAFKRIIDDAAKEGVLDIEEARHLAFKLDQVSHRIHMTDWAKSDTEKAYAVLLESSAVDRKPVMQRRVLKAKRQLDALVQRHVECSDDLADMQKMLLLRVGKAVQICAMSKKKHREQQIHSGREQIASSGSMDKLNLP